MSRTPPARLNDGAAVALAQQRLPRSTPKLSLPYTALDAGATASGTPLGPSADPFVWRPRSGPDAWSQAEYQAFLSDRANDGWALVRRFGISWPPTRRRERPQGPGPPIAPEAPSDDTDYWDGPPDTASQPHRGLSAIFRELAGLTRLPEDRVKLQRAMRAAAVALDWSTAFQGRTSVTIEELRRLSGRRIAAALRGRLPEEPRPVSDDLDAMWRSFPVRQTVAPAACWWVDPSAPDPRNQDVRLPPAGVRARTLNPAGLFQLHRRVCGRHEKSPDGSWQDGPSHWGCAIHQQIASLCDLRLPFRSGARPPPGACILYPQALETDPELASLLEEQVESDLALGSLVFARPLEPRIVVPTRGVFKWALRLSPEEAAACGEAAGHPGIPRVAALAAQRARAIAEDAVARSGGAGRASSDAVAAASAARSGQFPMAPPLAASRHGSGAGKRPAQPASQPSPPVGDPPRSPVCAAIRAACGPPKVRLVSGHHLGCNPRCESTPMVYRSVEELVGRIRRGWWIVVNDHHRGYKAMTLAPEDRPFLCLWHPTRPGVILMTVALDFGLKNAPYFFSTFTAMLLQQIQAWLGPNGFSMYYLDDNGTVCRPELGPSLNAELDVIAPVAGYDWALPKRQAGLSAKCLGRRFDSESNELSAVPSKIFFTLTLLGVIVGVIDAALSGAAPGVDRVETQFVRQVTGTLGWLASCSYAGLLHMGPFYYATEVANGAVTPRLSRIAGLREACLWWLDRAASGRLRGHKAIPLAGIPVLRLAFDTSFDLAARAAVARGAALTDAHNVATIAKAQREDGGLTACIQTDAGADAWAVIVNSTALWGRWQPEQRDWSSGGRELYGPLQVFLRLHEMLRDAFVVIGLDNASDALAVCLGRARAPVERRLMAALFEAAHDLGAEVAAWWCSRRMNAGSDELSKCTSPRTARSWADAHGLELIIVDDSDIRDGYAVGSLSAPPPPTA